MMIRRRSGVPDSSAKVLLIDLPSVSPNELNIGLAGLAAVLRAARHDVRVLDLNSQHVPGRPRARLRQALAWGPDVVALSLFPACELTYSGAEDVLRRARAALGERALLVAGGLGITVRPADGARRLAGLADVCVYGEGEVTFSYRDRRHAGAQKELTLSGEEFIRRFLLHVLPKGFKRIRHFGLLASRCKQEVLGRCRALLGLAAERPEPERKTPQEWMLQLTGEDVTRCPQCGQGTFRRLRPLAPASNRESAEAVLEPLLEDTS